MDLNAIKVFVKKNYALLIALVIVVAIAATTYFYDFYTLTLMAQRVASGHLGLYHSFRLSLSRYFYQAPPTTIFNGPPLMYLLDGSLYAILKFLHLITVDVSTHIPSIWQILVLKLRYIVVFLLSYPLIKRVAYLYTGHRIRSQRIANLWITSPLLLYLPFAQGNNDIYPAVFSLIFLFFVLKRQYFIAMLILGLMACLKNYALFLILPAAIILAEKDLRKTLQYVAIPLSAYVGFCLIYLHSVKYFFGGGGEGLFILQTKITAPIPYAVFPIIYFMYLLLLVFSNNQKIIRERKHEILIYSMLLITALFFITSYFYPQWVLWTLPFLVFVVYRSTRLIWLYLLMTLSVLALTLTYFVNYLDVGLFRPILKNPDNYIRLPHGPTISMLVVSFFVSTFATLLYLAKKQELTGVFKKEFHYVVLSLIPTLLILVYVTANVLVSNFR